MVYGFLWRPAVAMWFKFLRTCVVYGFLWGPAVAKWYKFLRTCVVYWFLWRPAVDMWVEFNFLKTCMGVVWDLHVIWWS